MTLISSLYAGQSGLETSSLDLSVIGDNIANANTIGFKGGRAAFEDALSQSLVGGAQLGLGAQLETIQKIITQGALTNTGLATDLALQGNGFFMVKGSHNGVDSSYYTRAGQFTLDKGGNLVNLEGLKVQGYAADAAGNITGQLGDLLVGNAKAIPVPTANVTVKANLDASAAVPAAWDPLNPQTTSNFSSDTTVYDSLGKAHATTIYFRKTGTGTWEWHAMTDGGGLTGGTAGTPTEIASGTLAFDTSGKLTTVTQASNFNPLGAVNPQPLNFNLGDPTGTGGTGLAGITQFASPSVTTFMSQDGYGSGDLAAIKVEPDGKITGSFTNGQTRTLGQVAVAEFSSPDKLDRVGGNLYVETPNAGQPTLGGAGAGGRGSIIAGALEQSNVDLAGEFVRMIAAQRSFQASAKTVTTADGLLQELMNIKR